MQTVGEVQGEDKPRGIPDVRPRVSTRVWVRADNIATRTWPMLLPSRPAAPSLRS